MEAMIFIFCLILHNMEEALWLTEWQVKNMPGRCPQKEHFIFSVLYES